MLLNTKEYSKAYTLMKCIIFFIIFFFIQDINAQCQVDGGNDVFLCVDKFGEVTNKPMLNANVITGKPPFEIKWKMESNWQDILLSNDTIMKPSISNYNGLWNNGKKVLIFINIKDSNGFKCKDSIYCILSQFAILSDLTNRTIKLGDTLKISPLTGGGIGVFTVSWSPNYNISDSLAREPKIWPRKTTTYYSTVIDSLGCKSSWNVSWTIYIDSTSSIIDLKKIEKFIPNFHNPINEGSIYEINNSIEIENIEIYNSISQKIFSTPSNKNLDIGKITSIKGTFYIVIQYKNNSKQSIKIIRE